MLLLGFCWTLLNKLHHYVALRASIEKKKMMTFSEQKGIFAVHIFVEYNLNINQANSSLSADTRVTNKFRLVGHFCKSLSGVSQLVCVDRNKIIAMALDPDILNSMPLHYAVHRKEKHCYRLVANKSIRVTILVYTAINRPYFQTVGCGLWNTQTERQSETSSYRGRHLGFSKIPHCDAHKRLCQHKYFIWNMKSLKKEKEITLGWTDCSKRSNSPFFDDKFTCLKDVPEKVLQWSRQEDKLLHNPHMRFVEVYVVYDESYYSQFKRNGKQLYSDIMAENFIIQIFNIVNAVFQQMEIMVVLTGIERTDEVTGSRKILTYIDNLTKYKMTHRKKNQDHFVLFTNKRFNSGSSFGYHAGGMCKPTTSATVVSS
ncbi:unnamed protein product, partial [Meganyctiphanes norvegica]